MADSYKVVAGAAVVKLEDGGEQMLLRGAVISGSAYKADDVKRLAKIGLIEAVKVEDQGPKPVEKMTADELKAYAAEHEIDLGDAKNKAEVLAAIKSAEAEPQGDGDGGPSTTNE